MLLEDGEKVNKTTATNSEQGREVTSERPPAFQFYPKDWLDWKVLRMSDSAQGIYIRLLAHMWKDSPDLCSLPNDDTEIAKVLGKTEKKWMKLRAELQQENDPIFQIEEGRLISVRLRGERDKLYRLRSSRHNAGVKGMESRWEGHSKANNRAITKPITKDNSSSSSSSSTSLKSTESRQNSFPDAESVMGKQPQKTRKQPIRDSQVQYIVNKWNELAADESVDLSAIHKLTPDRIDKIKVRIREDGFLEHFPEVLAKIKASSFLSGRKPSKDYPNWRPTLFWLIKNASKWVEILEGRHDDRREPEDDRPRRPYERRRA